MMQPKLGS